MAERDDEIDLVVRRVRASTAAHVAVLERVPALAEQCNDPRALADLVRALATLEAARAVDEIAAAVTVATGQDGPVIPRGN